MAHVRVFRHSNVLLVSHVRNLLESAGIPCELGNMTLGGGAGELPPSECEPEVRVGAEDRARAEALIGEAFDDSREPAQVWCCPRCGECLEGVFDTCWHCGTRRSK